VCDTDYVGEGGDEDGAVDNADDVLLAGKRELVEAVMAERSEEWILLVMHILPGQGLVQRGRWSPAVFRGQMEPHQIAVFLVP